MPELAGGFSLAPLVIAFPAAGVLANLALGRRRSEAVVGWMAATAIGGAFAVSLALLAALAAHPEGATVRIAEWIRIGDLDLEWSFRVDTLSVTMLLMVTGVSTLIHVYAIGYMHTDVRLQGDPARFSRFFLYFNLFVAFMLVLVTADNFLMLFVGWEGVGLCSYLLIGFWYEKGEAGIGNALAGKKAFIVNRVGDAAFLIALFLIFRSFGSLRFAEVFERAASAGPAAGGAITAIAFLLLVGATGKSAQLPLFVWLPDAMAGPTPVSALIHAATMVTAGIYMIVRTHVLFDLAPAAALAVSLVGAATALFAASIALGQFDIKRVLAYSTISQLGFMVAAVGLGAYVAGMFHLITHAFFKALLFLSAGSVIQGVEHGLHAAPGAPTHGHGPDPQDMRSMGGLRRRMPFTSAVYVIGALALAGVPPLAGFFSKDEILADALAASPLVYGLLTAAAFLTALYIGRQVFLVFGGAPRTQAAEHARENPVVMLAPLGILAGLSLVGGFLNFPGISTLGHWLAATLEEVHAAEFEWLVPGVSVGLSVVALATAYALYGRRALREGGTDPLQARLGWIFTALQRKWWVDELYAAAVVWPYVRFATFLAWTVDQDWWHDRFHDGVVASGFRRLTEWLALGFDLPVIDGAAQGLASLTQRLAGRLRRIQTGFVRTYALSLLVGSLLLLSYFLLS